MAVLTGVSGGEDFERKLRELADKISKPFVLRTGFLEDATYPDGTSVALVAAMLNFGISNGKKWPFMQQVLEAHSPEWGDYMHKLLEANSYDAQKALKFLGIEIENEIKTQINDTWEPKLEEVTVKRKGFEKPLIDTGLMWNSVRSEVTPGVVS